MTSRQKKKKRKKKKLGRFVPLWASFCRRILRRCKAEEEISYVYRSAPASSWHLPNTPSITKKETVSWAMHIFRPKFETRKTDFPCHFCGRYAVKWCRHAWMKSCNGVRHLQSFVPLISCFGGANSCHFSSDSTTISSRSWQEGLYQGPW